MNYYEWLNSFICIPIKEIENCLNKRFNYDLWLASGAAKHSEYMCLIGSCFHSPEHLRGNARAELVQYNKQFIYSVDCTEIKIKDSLIEIVYSFLKSYSHRNALVNFNNIGAGIAIRKIDGWLLSIYFTLRLN